MEEAPGRHVAEPSEAPDGDPRDDEYLPRHRQDDASLGLLLSVG
jgi:hypothetical protein